VIRLLVTGFGPFPHAPVNPTEALMHGLARTPQGFGEDVALTTAVIPTVYASLPEELAWMAATARPDIAVHFGLAARATGFRLEARARNHRNIRRIDAAGGLPSSDEIAPGETDRFSTLPLDAIETALRQAGLPVQRSEDCGDYLCNATFFHAMAHLVPDLRPPIAGFVHVPMPGPDAKLTEGTLEAGARLILAESVAAYRMWAAQPVDRLPNLGGVSAQRLAEIGVRTAGELGHLGALEAYRRWKAAHPRGTTRTVLWALIGALDRRPLTALSPAEKARWTAALER
jgi:pyroglutamyl-peptidase